MKPQFPAKDRLAVIPESLKVTQQTGFVRWSRSPREEQSKKTCSDFILKHSNINHWYCCFCHHLRRLHSLHRFGCGLTFENWLMVWNGLMRHSGGMNMTWRCSMNARWSSRFLRWDQLDTVRSCALYGRVRSNVLVMRRRWRISCDLRKRCTGSTGRMRCN